MKFSVLLPTRQGGKYLENCIRSVLDAGYRDLELVIADNANTDETTSIVSRYSVDARVRAIRTETVVSVCENWTRALAASSGDYVLMIGDDDAVLPNYFAEMERLLTAYGSPDCITYNGYSFLFPGSIGAASGSYYGESHFQFGPEFKAEGPLAPDVRLGLVRDMFRFRVRFPLNMQLTLVARRALHRVGDGVFRPPFPDHFALNALLLTAPRWIYTPEKLVVIGLSPKSFGHYVYSGDADAGCSYLGVEADFAGRLPGSELLNAMHVWLEEIRRTFGGLLGDIRVRRGAYVARQVYAWLREYRRGYLRRRDVLSRFRLLKAGDFAGLLLAGIEPASWSYLGRLARRATGIDRVWPGLRPAAGIADIREFVRWVEAGVPARGRP